MTHRIPARWYSRAAFLVLAVGVAIVFGLGQVRDQSNHESTKHTVDLIRREGRRARKAECQTFQKAVNTSVSRIRFAVIQVAGYQAPLVESASPDLREQVLSSNLRRRAFAVEQAKTIPDLRIDCSKVGGGGVATSETTSTSSTTTTTTGGTP